MIKIKLSNVLIFLIILFITSCDRINSYNNDKVYNKDLSVDSIIETFSLLDYFKKHIYIIDTSISDPIKINNFSLIFFSIDSGEYFNTLSNYYQWIDYPGIEMSSGKKDSYENVALKKDSFILLSDSYFVVSCIDSVIMIPKFETGYGEGADFQLETSYCGYIPEINLFVFWIMGYEGGKYFAINRNTSKRIDLIGYPKYSPNRKMILSSNCDVDLGYYDNGFDIHSFKNDSLINLFSYYPTIKDSWGPEGMIWKNDSTIYFIRLSYDSKGKPDQTRNFQGLRLELASH